jgi:hypothetical protein
VFVVMLAIPITWASAITISIRIARGQSLGQFIVGFLHAASLPVKVGTLLGRIDQLNHAGPGLIELAEIQFCVLSIFVVFDGFMEVGGFLGEIVDGAMQSLIASPLQPGCELIQLLGFAVQGVCLAGDDFRAPLITWIARGNRPVKLIVRKMDAGEMPRNARRARIFQRMEQLMQLLIEGLEIAINVIPIPAILDRALKVHGRR